MTAGKDMATDELLRRLNWYRDDWDKHCASVANFALRLAKLRSTGLARMPKHLRDALDDIQAALPVNPRGWTPEHKEMILATKLLSEHEPSLTGLDCAADMYAETRQALREVRRKRREENDQ